MGSNQNQFVSFEYYGLIPNDKTKAKHNNTKFKEAVTDIHRQGGGTLSVPNNSTYYIEIGELQIPAGVSIVGISRDKSIIQLVGPNTLYYSAITMGDDTSIRNITIKDDVTNRQQPTSIGIGVPGNPQALIEAKGSYITIEDCDLHNSSTWCVYTDDTALGEGGVPRRDYFTMKGCRNYWHKRSIYKTIFDISQVYVRCNHMQFLNNMFYTDAPEFSRTVFDLLGHQILIIGNITNGFSQPVLMINRIFPNHDVDIKEGKFLIKENVFIRCKIGMLLYPREDNYLSNVHILNNRITIDVAINSQVWDAPGNLIAGISVEPNFKGKIQDLSILNNVIEWIPKSRILASAQLVAGIALFNGGNGGYTLENCNIQNNTVKGFPFAGITLGTNDPQKTTKNIKVSNNLLVDNGTYNNLEDKEKYAPLVPYNDFYFTHIMLVTNNMSNVDITNNTIIDTGEEAIKGVYSFTYTPFFQSFKSIRIAGNKVMSPLYGLGTNIVRDSTAWGTNTGEPLYLDNRRLVLESNPPIKYCKDISTDIINYETNDIVITTKGTYKATGFGTTGILMSTEVNPNTQQPLPVKIVSIINESVIVVNDGKSLRAGNAITAGPGIRARIAYVKGNIVRIEDGASMKNVPIGSTLSYINSLVLI